VKLVNRVSVFFLAAMAVLLIVTSGAFYAFVRAQIVSQFEQGLRGPLNSLVAAVEIEPDDVSWQPREHSLALGPGQGPDEVHWVVIGDGQRVVEKSPHATPELVAQAQAIASRPAARSRSGPIAALGAWHILHQRLVAPAPDDTHRDLDEFDKIEIVVARSAAPLIANLHRLLLLAGALPVGIWLLAAVAGHWFCQKALQPVWDMSQQARSMTGANFHSRLPVTETKDELEDLALAFNTLLDNQQRAFEQQRRFAGDAAHELRTPLTVLLGQIDVALRRPRSPQEYAATLGLVREETVQLQTIVESLLFLARADEDAIPPDAEAFCLADWLPSYLTRWNEHPRASDISLQILPIGTGQVRASKALLARLLDNLLENALKYSSPGSKVELVATGNDAEILVEVQDHGRGIAAEDQARIFNPFFRTRAARDAGIAGTGLGLAIAARIATACGGRLDCTSQIGQGSRFTMRLPAVSSALRSV